MRSSSVAWGALPGLVLLLALACAPRLEEASSEVPGTPAEESARPEIRALHTRFAGLENLEKELEERSETPGELPFDLRLELLDRPDFPGLHSFVGAWVAGGPHAGKWLLVGGRTNGIHNLLGTSFPTDKRNTAFWVLDPVEGSACSAPLDGLLQDLYDQLASTNQQGVQVGDVLWVDGGYGWSENAQDNVTFGYLTALDVPRLAAAVLDSCGEPLADPGQYLSYGFLGGGEGADDDCRRFGPDTPDGPTCALSVTGGGMEVVGEGGDAGAGGPTLLLAWGQRFGGRYNEILHQSQRYTCQVVKIPLPEPAWGSTFEVGAVDPYISGDDECRKGGLHPSEDPFHRRDLNVEPSIYRGAGGELRSGLTTLGGVFRLDFFAFHEPIHVTAGEGGGATVDKAVKQHLNQYETASLNLYSEAGDTLHTVLLGGISSRHCTEGETGARTPQCTRTREVFPMAGFVEDGSLLSCRGGRQTDGGFACEAFEQRLLYRPFAHPNPQLPTGMLGSDAAFFPDPAVETYPNGVIRLDALEAGKETRVGYVYGGIEVTGSVPGQPMIEGEAASRTSAGERLFAVWIEPRG